MPHLGMMTDKELKIDNAADTLIAAVRIKKEVKEIKKDKKLHKAAIAVLKERQKKLQEAIV